MNSKLIGLGVVLVGAVMIGMYFQQAKQIATLRQEIANLSADYKAKQALVPRATIVAPYLARRAIAAAAQPPASTTTKARLSNILGSQVHLIQKGLARPSRRLHRTSNGRRRSVPIRRPSNSPLPRKRLIGFGPQIQLVNCRINSLRFFQPHRRCAKWTVAHPYAVSR